MTDHQALAPVQPHWFLGPRRRGHPLDTQRSRRSAAECCHWLPEYQRDSHRASDPGAKKPTCRSGRDSRRLKPLGVTQYELAKRVRVPMTRIAEICRRRRAITADTALRLARFFGTTSKSWLGLQEDYDLEEELRARRREIDAIEPLASDLPAA